MSRNTVQNQVALQTTVDRETLGEIKFNSVNGLVVLIGDRNVPHRPTRSTTVFLWSFDKAPPHTIKKQSFVITIREYPAVPAMRLQISTSTT